MTIYDDAVSAIMDMFDEEAVDAVYTRQQDEYDLRVLQAQGMNARDQKGFPVQVNGWDFVIQKSQLPITPKRGDKITVEGRNYEVLPTEGESCYRYCDPGEVLIRVHTKRTIS